MTYFGELKLDPLLQAWSLEKSPTKLVTTRPACQMVLEIDSHQMQSFKNSSIYAKVRWW